MITFYIYYIFSVPQYFKSGNHLEVSGSGEITNSDIKIKSQYDKMETCSILSDITSIGVNAFSGCSSLTSIELPSTLLKIKSGAFQATKLVKLTIPQNLELLEFSLTFKINTFKLFEIPISNSHFSVFDGVLYNEDQTTLLSCPTQKKSIQFSPNITEIGSFAFWQSQIDIMCIPDNVSKINTQSFVDPGTCVSIQFGLNSKLKYISPKSFYAAAFANITIPPSVVKIQSDGFFHSLLTSFSFMGESNLTHLEAKCFISCSRLETVKLPKSIESISDTAFSGCTKIRIISIQDGCKAYKSSLSGALLKADLTEIIFVPQEAVDLFIYNETKSISSSILQQLEKVPIENVTIDSGNEFIKYEGGIFYNSDFSQAKNALGSVEYVVIHSKTRTLSASLFKGIEKLKAVSFGNGSLCTHIGSSCFASCANLEFVDLPNTITNIDERAFQNSGIKNFTIPKSLKEINPYTFSDCGKLESLYSLPNSSLTTISGSTFSGSALKTCIFPDSLKYIGSNSFSRSKIEQIVFPKNLQTIDSSAFYYTQLSKITFEDDINLSQISSGAFSGTKITSIRFPRSLSTLQSSAFKNCVSLTTVEFEEGCNLTEIPSNAFEGCELLNNFPIIPSLEKIDASCFISCFQLNSFVIEDPSINHFVFVSGGLYNKTKQALYLFPPGLAVGKVIAECVELVSNSFYCDSLLQKLEFDEGSRIESIGTDTFFGCSSISSLTLPASLQSISDGCFKDCTNLSIVTFRDGSLLQTIGSSTFEGCKMLKIIDFGSDSHLESIGDMAFNGCNVLSSILFPKKIKKIGVSAFADCSSLESVRFETNTSINYISIPSMCFARCKSLYTVDLPRFVQSIESDAFIECKALNFLFLNEGLKSINDRAFMSCGLPFVDIPSSVSEIGSQAFSSNAGLRSVVVRSRSGLSLKSNCFSFCEHLMNVSFCAEESILCETPILKGSNLAVIYGLASYPSDSIGEGAVLKVMDRCLVYPSAFFSVGHANNRSLGLLAASLVESEGE